MCWFEPSESHCLWRSLHFWGEVWPQEIQWASRFSSMNEWKFSQRNRGVRACAQDVKERVGESRHAERVKSSGEEGEEGWGGQRWRGRSDDFFKTLFFSLWKWTLCATVSGTLCVQRGCCRHPLTGQPAKADLLQSHFLPPDLYKAQDLGAWGRQVQYEAIAATHIKYKDSNITWWTSNGLTVAVTMWFLRHHDSVYWKVHVVLQNVLISQPICVALFHQFHQVDRKIANHQQYWPVL